MKALLRLHVGTAYWVKGYLNLNMKPHSGYALAGKLQQFYFPVSSVPPECGEHARCFGSGLYASSLLWPSRFSDNEVEGNSTKAMWRSKATVAPFSLRKDTLIQNRPGRCCELLVRV